MFIGHYAPAFVAATQRKAPGLGTLFVAAQLVDFGFFAFLILGIEHMRLVPGATTMNAMDLYSMPFTHSLAGALAWSIGFGALLWVVMRSRTAALLGGLVVLSHWLIDLLVHAPDLTLWGSPPRLGLGLWNHPLVEIPLELAFAFGGLAWYWRHTRPTTAAGRWSPWVLGVLMAALQAYNWLTPQPDAVVDPVPTSIGYLGITAYVLLALAAWWVAATRSIKA